MKIIKNSLSRHTFRLGIIVLQLDGAAFKKLVNLSLGFWDALSCTPKDNRFLKNNSITKSNMHMMVGEKLSPNFLIYVFI